MKTLDLFNDFDRKYSKTHPWISFQLDLNQAPPRMWMLLGEARSKCDELARIPLKPWVAQELHRLYLVKGVRGSTAIEGNTLDEEQIQKILAKELELPPSQDYLKREVENILKACTDLAGDAPPGGSLTTELIQKFNTQVLSGLELPERVKPGKFRRYSVGVARYRAAPWEDCPYLMDRLCDWLDELSPDPSDMASEILRAVLAHLYLAWIHPFGDGNGRTARLMEFNILIGAGVPTPAAHLLSNHYNLTRDRYLRELDRASRSGGDVVPFLLYAIEGFVEQLQEQLGTVRQHQIRLAWRDYVHEYFAETQSATHVRRRDLLLDLSWNAEPVKKADIRTLSARIERAYREKTPKTITRDLNWLVDKELLTKAEDGYSAHTAIIFGFLPKTTL